jgi:anti-sigma B factor antagonist
MALDIARTESDGAVVLTLMGQLDAVAAGSLDTALGAALADAKAVVMDLAALRYASSAGLRILLKGAKSAKADGKQLVLAALDPAVREVFEISGFSSIFQIEPTREKALAGL